MPNPFEIPSDDDALFGDKWGRAGLGTPAGGGGQSPSGAFGGGGFAGALRGFGNPDPLLAYSPMARRRLLDQTPLSERTAATPTSPNTNWGGGNTMPMPPNMNWGGGGSPMPGIPPGMNWGGGLGEGGSGYRSPEPPSAPPRFGYNDYAPPPQVPQQFDSQGPVGGVQPWQKQRGMSGPLNTILGPGTGSRTILGPTNPGGSTILGPSGGGSTILGPSGGAPRQSGPSTPSPSQFNPPSGPRGHQRTGNPEIDSWFDYQEGKGDQHTILNIINGIISGALDPYLEGTPFGKNPSAGVMDATRRNATQTADALSQRTANQAALYGGDPSQRGSAALQSYLNTQGGISNATNNVLDQHAMARDEWIKSLLAQAAGYNYNLGTSEFNNIWNQRLQPPDPQWYDYLAGTVGQVGGAWLGPH